MPGDLYIHTHTVVIEQDGNTTTAITESQCVNRDPISPLADLELLRRALKTTEIYPAVFGKKYCPMCGELRSVEAFSKSSVRKDGLAAYCKACESERFKRWKLTQAQK